MPTAAIPPAIAALLAARAAVGPERSFAFLDDGERAESRLSYAALQARVSAVAGGLRGRAARGERVPLPLPPGLAYTVAVLSCAAASLAAVPCRASRRSRAPRPPALRLWPTSRRIAHPRGADREPPHEGLASPHDAEAVLAGTGGKLDAGLLRIFAGTAPRTA